MEQYKGNAEYQGKVMGTEGWERGNEAINTSPVGREWGVRKGNEDTI